MRLNQLIKQTEEILKETAFRFEKPVLLWSGGKDSTCLLSLARRLFSSEKFPFQVMQIDTGFKFKKTYEYIDKYSQKWHLPFLRYQNKEAIDQGINPFDYGRLVCCQKLKTEALKKAIEEYKFDAVITAIRRDEHSARSEERFFSPRKNPFHCRIHPLLDWTEDDIWQYLKENGIPLNPLYQPKNGLIYRSLGCWPCTKPVKISQTKKNERAGREKEKEEIMEKLRRLGYF